MSGSRGMKTPCIYPLLVMTIPELSFQGTVSVQKATEFLKGLDGESIYIWMKRALILTNYEVALSEVCLEEPSTWPSK